MPVRRPSDGSPPGPGPNFFDEARSPASAWRRAPCCFRAHSPPPRLDARPPSHYLTRFVRCAASRGALVTRPPFGETRKELAAWVSRDADVRSVRRSARPVAIVASGNACVWPGGWSETFAPPLPHRDPTPEPHPPGCPSTHDCTVNQSTRRFRVARASSFGEGEAPPEPFEEG